MFDHFAGLALQGLKSVDYGPKTDPNSPILTAQKMKFTLRISSVNVTKSSGFFTQFLILFIRFNFKKLSSKDLQKSSKKLDFGCKHATHLPDFSYNRKFS